MTNNIVVEDVQSVAFNGRLLRKQNTARHRSEVDLTRDSDLTAIGGRLVRNTRGSEHRKIDSSGSVVVRSIFFPDLSQGVKYLN
jgi:hypothetical protein